MSKNKSTSTTNPTMKPERTARTRAAEPTNAESPAPLIGSQPGIDYGPAIEAIDDVLGWAFEVATKSVAGWPQGKRRVRNAFRYLRAIVRGKRVRTEPREDVMFTAALLIRVLDADLGLGMCQIADVLDQLGLPSDHVPFAKPEPVVRRPMARSTWERLLAIFHALTPDEAATVREVVTMMTPAERELWVDALRLLTIDEGLHLVRAYLRGAIRVPPPRALGHSARAPGVASSRATPAALACASSPLGLALCGHGAVFRRAA